MTSNLEQYVGYIDTVRDISTLSAQRERGDNPDRINKAIDDLENIGYDAIRELYGDDIDESRLTPEQKSQLAKNGLTYKQREQLTKAGKLLDSNLEGILGEIEASELEKASLNEKVRESGDNNKYGEVLRKYEGYLGAKSLAEKYSRGEASDKELQIVYESVGDVVSDKIRGRLSAEGLDKDTIEIATSTAKALASIGVFKKEYIDKAMGKFVEDSEREFRDFEASKGLKVADYVKGSLTKMRNSDDVESTALARDLIYSLAKAKLSKKEE